MNSFSFDTSLVSGADKFAALSVECTETIQASMGTITATSSCSYDPTKLDVIVNNMCKQSSCTQVVNAELSKIAKACQLDDKFVKQYVPIESSAICTTQYKGEICVSKILQKANSVPKNTTNILCDECIPS